MTFDETASQDVYGMSKIERFHCQGSYMAPIEVTCIRTVRLVLHHVRKMQLHCHLEYQSAIIASTGKTHH